MPDLAKPTDASHPVLAPEDVARMRRWFGHLAECVEAVDFAAARPLFAEDMVAFGTVKDFVRSRADVEREQWRRVWPTIRRFRWRLEGLEAVVSGDRLTGVGMAVFDSDGFDEQGRRFERRGRATVAFTRPTTADPWVAVHTHMSLFPGTPRLSHGAFAGPEDEPGAAPR